MTEPELHKPHPVKVPADAPWYHTGISLRKEHVYRFEVSPPEQTWIDASMKPFTADGRIVFWAIGACPFLRMPSVKWFALLGCIDKKRDTYFKIGIKKESYSPETDGELVCFANDALGHYENNKGEMNFTITRIS